jgi:hypothetical protein
VFRKLGSSVIFALSNPSKLDNVDIIDDTVSKNLRNGYHESSGGTRFIKLDQPVYPILLLSLYLIVYGLNIYFYFLL